jgi:hypothetical protein
MGNTTVETLGGGNITIDNECVHVCLHNGCAVAACAYTSNQNRISDAVSQA